MTDVAEIARGLTKAHLAALHAAAATCRADLAIVRDCNATGRYRSAETCQGTNGQPHETLTIEAQIQMLEDVGLAVRAHLTQEQPR